MISVVIPTLNAEARLVSCLEALVAPTMSGVVREVIIVDGGSSDDTARIADGFGATLLTASPGRGGQLRAGAEAARSDWLLFLHGDTALTEDWVAEAEAHIDARPDSAAVFSLSFDSKGIAAKFVSAAAMFRTRAFALPYGDQGLLISRALYDEVGGYKDIPLFEDVDIIRRLIKKHGRGVLQVLNAKAVTSAERYEREGYLNRVFRNFVLLMRYQLGASPEALAKAYR